MEENATPTERPSTLVTCPNTVITSTVRVTPTTRKFMKVMSALTGASILPRGKSRLDDIAYIAKKAGFTSFLVIFSYKGQPSRIDIYSLRPEGYFEKLGLVIMRSFNLFASPPACVGMELSLAGSNAVSKNLWRILMNAFGNDDCSKYRGGKISKCQICDENLESVISFWWKEKLLAKILVRHVKCLRE
ncbi:MAG: hypothetical protein NDP13_02155 [Crenarchaeota archaeon]|nr:hypothetical protein [Thermoproteota archaeon]MCR8455137.1 hypothetical protein [Thermoproteota archaeon]MCR8501478.1 hypothetical protein [Thermoproteota archaeon]